ncbi:MAG TPA: lytic transglycosylase domain-containing protein [Arthrobacter sp.]|nr:lytic transglycosylase domain-containing protein [Arthrobacter sp.]
MLRVKRFVVFSLFVLCASAAFSFWMMGQPGAGANAAPPAPPRAAARLQAAADGLATAVNVTPVPESGWLGDAAAATGIPGRALRAYVNAAVSANQAAPACGIGWNTLAAVGFVESAHGTYGGGSLGSTGQASGPIVGPSLNGAGFAAIPDTDGGALDGDAHWDHAVGPMQFIPSTWRIAGMDGNGDGAADPFNIDDAALSAATYLCTRGGDLTTAQGWTDAVHAYNQSDAYLRQVRSQAAAYAAAADTVQ